MLFLILVSLLLAGGFLLAYLKAAKSGQFDDEYTPAIRILFDDAVVVGPSKEEGLPTQAVVVEEQMTTKDKKTN